MIVCPRLEEGSTEIILINHNECLAVFYKVRVNFKSCCNDFCECDEVLG